MNKHNDTIAAIATPVGIGGISVIRISGENAFGVLSKIFKGNVNFKQLTSHSIYHGKIVDDENRMLDDVLVSIFIEPRSYTGENVVEISCHGGMFVTQKVLQQVLNQEVRHARKGEFTQRAFLNGKLDLTEAEAVIDLINSKTIHSLESAINQLEGRLYNSIKNILDEITEIRSNIELDIDFSDQGLEGNKKGEKTKKLYKIKNKIGELAATGNKGIMLNEGYHVVIAGPTNAGKSSIFNRIIENERSIVTDIAGTTRDYIEEDISLEGYLVKLFDTAGIRTSEDQIEKAGIKKALNIIDKTDLVLWVQDSSVSRETIPGSIKKKSLIVINNKIDLMSDLTNLSDGIAVSATTGEGISELKNRIVQNIETSYYDLSEGLITNSRQLSAIENCNKAINRAILVQEENRGLEFMAFELREASEYLEEIIGKVTSEEIINSIFDRFCVGK